MDHASIFTHRGLAKYVAIRYDPVALLACLPATRHFFHPTVKRIYGVDHLVIGTSEENPGILPDRVDEIQDFLYTSFFRGVTVDFSEFENTKSTMESSEELKSRKIRMAELDREASETRIAVPSSHPLRLTTKEAHGKVTPLLA